jgi:hypothetical protein
MFGQRMFGRQMFGLRMFSWQMFGRQMFGRQMFGRQMFGRQMFDWWMFGGWMFGQQMFGQRMFGQQIFRSTNVWPTYIRVDEFLLYHISTILEFENWFQKLLPNSAKILASMDISGKDFHHFTITFYHLPILRSILQCFDCFVQTKSVWLNSVNLFWATF